jgi:hypothetical protein
LTDEETQMKQLAVSILLTLTSLFLGVSAARGEATTAPATEGTALLSNSDFSKANQSGDWPEGWGHPKGATWEKEGEMRFVRLTSSEPGQMVLMYRQMALPSPAPAALEIRVKVRYSDIKAGEKKWFDGRLMGHFKNAEGKVLKGDPKPIAFKGTSKGWVEKSEFVKVPAGAHVLELMPCLFQPASGTLDWGKVEVLTATEDQLPKPPPIVPSALMVPADASKLPPMLHVAGNELQTPDGKAVWLQGVCIDSMEWSAVGERILKSIPVAMEQWHSNAIRLPVKANFWFGRGPWQQKDPHGLAYRKLVDDAVNAVAAHGGYIAIDLHRFGAPSAEDVEFWKDVATRYKDNPAVLFELFNEPHSISWKVWRDGGSLADGKHKDVNVAENTQAIGGETSVGMQALVDAARSTGAKNIIIAGGLDWGYDLTGVASGEYVLNDKGGNGIMYSSHIYPWKKDWQKNTLDAAAKFPIFVGEVGTPPDYSGFQFIPKNQRYPIEGWAQDMIGLIQKYKLNWTGFSFHPKCGPMLISDWDYTPTPYWGVYVKEALAGKQFEVKKMR